MKLHELVSESLLVKNTVAGYISSRTHPELPLAILNYTKKAAYDRHWDDVTRKCRGLIYNYNTMEIVARPFEKFFNWGEKIGTVTVRSERKMDLWEERDVIVTADLSTPCVAYDKLDGSLGILYPTPDGYAVATRGSFTSTQAIAATELLREKLAGEWSDWRPAEGATYLVEIILPENRIVCDYGDTRDLVLLAALDTESGKPHSFAYLFWPGRPADWFPKANTVGEALALPPRPGAEGLVLYLDSGERIKIKQDDYRALHKLLTTASARKIWEHLAVNDVIEGEDAPNGVIAQRLSLSLERFDEILMVGEDWMGEMVRAGVPEFTTWVLDTAQALAVAKTELKQSIQLAFHNIKWNMTHSGDARHDRAYFAYKVKDLQHRAAMFALWDEREIDSYCWKMVYPKHNTPFMKDDEDV